MDKRENFGSRLGFILVSAGCAIGIGNVWKFPYVCGQNGGAIFIGLYLICLLLLGLPILVSEFAIGRASKRSIAMSFNILEPKGTRWHTFRWYAIIGNYLLMMFYTCVAGWMINYAFKMLNGSLMKLEPEAISEKFSEMLASPVEMTIFMLIAVIFAFSICGQGLQNGVERITKVMMLGLIVLMIVLAVHSLMLPNVKEGLSFYLVPNFQKVQEIGLGNVIFAAMTQAFFTLSIGMGSMSIFGSYLDKDHALTSEAANVTILDTLVALMAGIIIIPACFAYGIEPDSGPSLLFITLPNVFTHMAGGRIWGTAFFLFMSVAALSTVIAVFENILAMTMDTFGWDRKKAVRINQILVIVLSMPAVLGFNLLSGIQPIGAGSSIMDLEDFLVSNNILPLGSLLMVLFCTKKNGWGWDNFVREANEGRGIKYPSGIRSYVKFAIPLMIIVIYLKGYYDKFSQYGTTTLIFWMCVAAAFLALIFSFAFGKSKDKNA